MGRRSSLGEGCHSQPDSVPMTADYFADSFQLLQQEGELVHSCLCLSLTQLRSASASRKGAISRETLTRGDAKYGPPGVRPRRGRWKIPTDQSLSGLELGIGTTS